MNQFIDDTRDVLTILAKKGNTGTDLQTQCTSTQTHTRMHATKHLYIHMYLYLYLYSHMYAHIRIF